MFVYRLTKYDPSKRNTEGAFTANEWTSVSDIGRTFDGESVSISDYVETENAYVNAVRTVLAASNIASMRVTALELRPPERQEHLTDGVLESCRRVRNRQCPARIWTASSADACANIWFIPP